MQGTFGVVIAFEIAPTTFRNGLLLQLLGVGGERGAGESEPRVNSHAEDALKLCFQQFFSYKCVS